MIYVENLREHYKITLLLLVAVLGIFFEFIGLCMEQSGLNSLRNSGPNILGANWFFLFFNITWLLIMVVAAGSGNMRTYRFFLLALTAVALSYLPGDIHSSIANTSNPFGSISAGGGLKAAGLIILFFPVLAILGLLGAEEDSSLHRNTIMIPFSSGDDAEKAANAAPHYTSGNEGNMRPQSEFMNPVVASGMGMDAAAAAANEARNSVKPESRINVQADSVVAFKARTLYAYEANPADPTEISFKKGEILNVIDSKGKWWHVQKVNADGSITSGIAPSNYLQTV